MRSTLQLHKISLKVAELFLHWDRKSKTVAVFPYKMKDNNISHNNNSEYTVHDDIFYTLEWNGNLTMYE